MGVENSELTGTVSKIIFLFLENHMRWGISMNLDERTPTRMGSDY
jgi:hypothetical protein